MELKQTYWKLEFLITKIKNSLNFGEKRLKSEEEKVFFI